MNEEHESHGYKPIPEHILKNVATTYSSILQNKIVKRSTAKLKIIAALVYRACISEKFIILNPEVVAFAGLRAQGMSKGDNFVRAMSEKDILDIDINEDRLVPHINTIFNQLGLFGKEYDRYKNAVQSIVERAIRKRIGNDSVLRSKAVSTTFNILKRSDSEKLRSITIADMANKCEMRIYTIKRFLDQLSIKHKGFVKYYKKYGFDQSEISEWV